MARLAALTLALTAVAVFAATGAGSAPSACTPTRADSLGPYYEPGAPVRARVGGGGYVLSGRVRAARTCRAISRARIEFWLVNDDGEYDDAHRATVFARRDGSYRFESNRPVGYGGRPPHIHVRVSARGFRPLVTQHYPKGTRNRVTFNLVLVRR